MAGDETGREIPEGELPDEAAIEEEPTVIAPGWEPGAVQPAEVVETETVVATPPPRRRPPLLWPALLAVLFLALAGVGAAYYLSQRDDEGSAPTATVQAERVTVPDVSGMEEGVARDRMVAAGLEPTSTLKPSPKPKGTVVSQTPAAGTTVEKGDGVALVVSKGPAVKGVPNVVGMPAADATAALTEAGFESKATQAFAQQPKGIVAKQTPKPGAKAKKGAVVTLVVSKGRKPVPVPDVTGQPGSAAVATLRSAGFAVVVAVVPSAQTAGTVVAQNPPAGTPATPGSRVRVNVAAAPASTTPGSTTPTPAPAKATVPDVVGQPRADAVQAFADAGLKASIVYVPSQEPEGTVVAQAKPPGTKLARGSSVQVNVSLGPKPAQQQAVPDVVGLDEKAARDLLKEAGFKAQAIAYPVDDPSQEGLVLDQQPVAGSKAPRGSEITIYVGTAG